ncbi:MAG TPA: tRNA uridine-5-carboxymethylaminomethyl(34) synthesis GTPase MnmE [Thermomicrobiales bacterium]|nr:tRNA uridine-5-carboxymethylaminomethyl(34) synthesis GTPase MnmE [Thermomicrobiales bacterium]
MYHDTIVAVATPLGEGGIAIVRLSGPDAGTIGARIFRRGSRLREVAASFLSSHHMYYGSIVDSDDSRTIDEVMLVRMAPPRTYTREEVVEISCHGGPVPVREVLGLCLRHGARLAEPGEFTLRAFLNGRIDLSQAEAVAGVVSARTSRSLDLAIDELRGRLTERLRPARDSLVETLAYLDAAADFPDDEIPSIELGPALETAREALAAVVNAAGSGLLYREGVQIAIVGRPNAGKSSLLNTLLRADRAIVTEIAGTTRDVIAESINLAGLPATLLDTAGIAESEDIIEQMGIARSRQALASSGIALFVIDRSQPAGPEDIQVATLLAERLGDGGVLVARNKSDLPDASNHEPVLSLLPGVPVVDISTQTSEGIAELEMSLHDLALAGSGAASEPALVTVRQHDALRRSLASVEAAQDGHALGLPLDLLAVDVRAALHAVGEVTGEHVDAAVLDEIFSRFCIGK